MAVPLIPIMKMLMSPQVWGPLMGYMALSKAGDITSSQMLHGKQMSLEERKLNAMVKAMTNKQEVEERMYGEMKTERGEQRNYLASMREGDRAHETNKMMLTDMLGSDDRNMALMMSMLNNSQPTRQRFPQNPMPYAQLTQL